jgi:hypothetical protein
MKIDDSGRATETTIEVLHSQIESRELHSQIEKIASSSIETPKDCSQKKKHNLRQMMCAYELFSLPLSLRHR